MHCLNWPALLPAVATVPGPPKTRVTSSIASFVARPVSQLIATQEANDARQTCSMSTSHLQFRRKLGDALYGEVMECELHARVPVDEPLVVAVKCMSLSCAADVRSRFGPARVLDDPLQERRVAELLALSGGHRNVAAAYFHFQKGQWLYLVGELCTDGDLHTRLAADGPMDERNSMRIMTQICCGLDFLHRELGIAHRDLSLENVLLRDGECKISDFGLSVDAGARCSARVGKAYYMAPEVVAGRTYDPVKADVWSLGIMWFILLTGSPLISIASEHNKAFMELAQCGVGAVFEAWGFSNKLSAEVMELIAKMLSVDPADRISLHEVLEHPCLKSG
ncbi:unnamed protein product [Phytophthora fragariaefolia]|uniref:Unnamed protein product n=1 Tax=Phytophthora fragariaefolia TaxID=1490495 RepID=A0A9W6XM54_9STRA|nr:unnamed protein product [Phytophthora fragariaefolia]